MVARESRVRILMFPYLAHGHVFSFVALAKNLSSRNFHIYLCSTPVILDSIKTTLNNNNDDNNNIELVELHLPYLRELPPRYHSTKNVPPDLMPTLLKAFQESAPPVFSDIITELKPDLLVYDILQPWAAKAAATLGIPRVLYSTGGAAAFAFSHHSHTHGSYGGFPFEALFLREHEMKIVSAEDEEADQVKGVGELGFMSGIFDLSSDVVLFKTSRAVEGKYMEYLATLCGRKVVPSGPLITFYQESEKGSSAILKWLGERERHSTLYISFGSENYFSKEQMREIAIGLELSGVNFVWVARQPAGGGSATVEEAAPEGFLCRVRGRGIVVAGWAPQAAILAHRSVGGFMSHCGWGAVTESLYFGVPVVALPLKHDQPLNARLVVEFGTGVEVARDGEDGGFDGKGVAEAVREVVGKESGARLRSRAREMREKLRAEEKESCDEIAEELTRLCTRG